MVGFDYCVKKDFECWCCNWDCVLFVGLVIFLVIFGVVFGNLFIGLLFEFDEFLCFDFKVGLLGLLIWFLLLVGFLSLSMLVMYGGVWLGLKISDELWVKVVWLMLFVVVSIMLLFGICGIWIFFGMKGFVIEILFDFNVYNDFFGKLVVV